jgi:hypothetical protein
LLNFLQDGEKLDIYGMNIPGSEVSKKGGNCFSVGGGALAVNDTELKLFTGVGVIKREISRTGRPRKDIKRRHQRQTYGCSGEDTKKRPPAYSSRSSRGFCYFFHQSEY